MIPSLQLLDEFIESGEVTQQETESVMAGAFSAILVAGVLAGLVLAFKKVQAEMKK